MTSVSPSPTADVDLPTCTRPLRVRYPELAGTVAVVTGAAGGIGARFAAGLTEQGVTVVGADLDGEQMRAQAESVNANRDEDGGRLVAAMADVADPSALTDLAQQVVAEHGRLDHWVNNAGVFPHAPVGQISAEQMRQTFGVNVDGVLHGAQAAAAHMGSGASIVNMASVAGVRVRPGRAAYAASKAAVEHMTHCLAVELGDSGIRVNAIAPGFIDTEMTRWVREQPGAAQRALESVPLGRIGSPEEVLGVLMFLLSDSARYITGHTLAVDGGSRYA